MEATDLPQHKIEPWMFPEAQEIRREAPSNLISLIEAGVLENVTSLSDLAPSQVSVVAGGENSACYFLRNNDQPAIVKFRHAGSQSETQALIAWGESGLPVPKVLSHGVVLRTQDFEKPVKYLLEEAIVNTDGNLTQTGFEFIAGNPDKLTAVGSRMGEILARIHGVKASGIGFGGFADTWGNANGLSSFQDYLVGSINFQRNVLTREGIPSESIDAIVNSFKKVNFPAEGVYIHGDYGLHNALVRNEDPNDVIVFDPNPLVADPYWDIAAHMNKLEAKRLKVEAHPDNVNYREEYDKESLFVGSLFDAYKKETGEEFDEKRLNAIRFARLVRKIEYDSRKETSSPEVSDQIKKDKVLIDLEFYRMMMRDLGVKLASDQTE